MPLWLRRIIYLSFIALFLLVAPILALYSMGYRYHWGKHRFERTGLLVVDGEPRDALIRLDGTVLADRLPARIGGLGENEYALRVEREGFLPLEQRVTITSGRTISLSNVRLFRATEPTLAFTGRITQSAVSANRHWLALLRSAASFEELWLWDLESDTRTLVLRIPEISNLQLSWSPRNAMLLVRSTSDAIVITPGRTLATRSILPLLPGRPTAVAWELADDHTLVANVERRLFRVNLTTGRTIALGVPTPSTPFALARSTLYVADGARILAMPLSGEAPALVATLPERMAIARFTDLRGTQLDAESTDSAQLLTIGTTDGNVRTRSGFGLHWTQARDAALWQTNAFELWAESGTPAQPHLLVRREVPLTDAAWLPEGQHVVFATARDVTVLALDPSTRPATTLTALDDIRAIAAPPDGDTLLIVGRRGTEEGVWTLPLR